MAGKLHRKPSIRNDEDETGIIRHRGFRSSIHPDDFAFIAIDRRMAAVDHSAFG